jgi:hypothetical protein
MQAGLGKGDVSEYCIVAARLGVDAGLLRGYGYPLILDRVVLCCPALPSQLSDSRAQETCRARGGGGEGEVMKARMLDPWSWSCLLCRLGSKPGMGVVAANGECGMPKGVSVVDEEK